VIRVVGGETALRDAVIRASGEAEVEARAVPPGGKPAPAAGDVLVDLGLPPRDWPAGDLAAAEAARVAELAAGLPDGVRVVRASMLGAAPDARSELQRAHGAAEEAWRGVADVVALRAGLLLGTGLAGALKRLVERSFVVPVAGIASARLEPLLADDFARYCVEAAAAAGPLDDFYELGCGEILTGELLAKGLADNLGVRRWVVPLPRLLQPVAVGLLAGPELPARAVRRTLDAAARGLLPRRMTAWDAFAVRPVDLRMALAAATGARYPLRRRDDRRFGSWQAPERKGILWTKSGGRRRR
jgi:uncharacterized protein YbjT (DUF2867 family)